MTFYVNNNERSTFVKNLDIINRPFYQLVGGRKITLIRDKNFKEESLKATSKNMIALAVFLTILMLPILLFTLTLKLLCTKHKELIGRVQVLSKNREAAANKIKNTFKKFVLKKKIKKQAELVRKNALLDRLHKAVLARKGVAKFAKKLHAKVDPIIQKRKKEKQSANKIRNSFNSFKLRKKIKDNAVIRRVNQMIRNFHPPVVPQVPNPVNSIPSVPPRPAILGTNRGINDEGRVVNDQQRIEFDQKFTVTQTLNRKIEVSYKNPKCDKLALFIYPMDDHNNAFALNDHLKFRFLAMSQEYSIKLVYVSSAQEMEREILKAKEGEIEHLCLGGHGGFDHLSFDIWQAFNTRTVFANNPFSRLSKTATIFLDSCNTGASSYFGGPNLLQHVAKLAPGRFVYAPKLSFGKTNLVLDSVLPWMGSCIKEGADQMEVCVY